MLTLYAMIHTMEIPKNVNVISGPAENMSRSINEQIDVMIARDVGM